MDKLLIASSPPMGWNSWDCFGCSVNEAEVLNNAHFMAEHLKPFGWEYIVIDIQWSDPKATAGAYRSGAELVMDEYGRLWPAENRFPSAAGGKGFGPLSKTIHAMGLKFGIHIMRGIPRNAVLHRLPIKGATGLTAADIADTNSVCAWNDDMYGVDMSKPGAQAWYDSNAELYASWDIDYIKADDMSAPSYHAPEIEALQKAIRKVGHPMIVSLSPGPAPLEQVKHLRKHAHLWRISNDFWDDWKMLREQFELCRKWIPHIAQHGWPDLDILPVGRIGIRGFVGEPRYSKFTPDEQCTLFTLWSMMRSPLMIGGHLTETDASTLKQLTNRDIIYVNRHSVGTRELYWDTNTVWVSASDPANHDLFLAGFNLTDDFMPKAELDLACTGIQGRCQVKDLWNGKRSEPMPHRLVTEIPPHGAVLFRLTPAAKTSSSYAVGITTTTPYSEATIG